MGDWERRERKLVAFETRDYRMMVKISWLNRQENKEVLSRAEENGNLLKQLKRRIPQPIVQITLGQLKELLNGSRYRREKHKESSRLEFMIHVMEDVQCSIVQQRKSGLLLAEYTRERGGGQESTLQNHLTRTKTNVNHI